MPKENNKVDINKHEIDIDTLFKQNVNDLCSIKELYRKLKEVEERISQIKYIDSTLAYRLKKDYEKLKEIILDENIQSQLYNEINNIKTELDKIKDNTTILESITKVEYRNINNSAFEVGDISDNGEATSNSSYARTKSFIKVVGGKTIYLKKLVGANVYDIFEYDGDFNLIKITRNIYEYNQVDYTRTLTLNTNTKYIKFKCWWTTGITDMKVAVYYEESGITEYEEYTEPIKVRGLSNDFTDEYKKNLDDLIKNSKGLSNKPIVVFNFDETSLDNRYTALQNAGFTGTWQFAASSLQNDKDIINTLIKNGHDISPYNGLSDEEYKDTANFQTSIEKLKNLVVKELEDMKKLGIYNPVMFSCSRHRSGYVVKEAIKDLKFKYIRCTWGVNQDGKDYYVPSINNPEDREQTVLPLNRYNTFEKVKAKLDELIASNAPLIMPMCHTMTYDGITEENYFENLVGYVKSLSDSGKVKVMNMREYYEYYFSEQGGKDDRTRIMSAINDIKNLNLT